MGFKKGEGGRPKGATNKATREIKVWAEAFLSSDAYVTSAQRRVLAGKAPHLETLWYHYAYGKPKETVELDGTVNVDIAGARERLARQLAGLTGRLRAGDVPGQSKG